MATRRLTRRERQELTRNAILRSAATLFARRGVEGTSMEEIARHAGLTQGAIYSNFSSKADLWWAIADQMSQTLQFEDFFTGERSLGDELRDASAAAAKLLRDVSKTDLLLDQEFTSYWMRHPKVRARVLKETRELNTEIGARFDAIAAKRGTALPMPGERLAQLLGVIARGLLHLHMLDPEAIDEEFCVQAFALLAGSDEPSRRPSGTGAGSSHPEAPGSRRRSTRVPRKRG
jgi:AcrR family transcriptional regulator